MSLVTLYSKPHFGGSQISLDEGNIRLHDEANFNDATVSVRVASGYCAILYEHANEFGGYGTSITLLGDCINLTKYGFDSKTSFISVFKRQIQRGNGNYHFVPGRLKNGAYVDGHWERVPAAGIPSPETFAPAVSPAIPAPTQPPPEGGAVRDHTGGGGGSSDAPGGVVVTDASGQVVGGATGTPPEHEPGFDGVVRDHRKSGLKHIFVLVLENRSFDHMLGFSGITGTDAKTGEPTSINGLTGNESNSHNGVEYKVIRGAPDVSPLDPGHGFGSVLEQLCGPGSSYPSRGAYPAINNSGFAANYAKKDPNDPAGAMRCFTPDQLPVITQLAREFVVCDNWFCSMPGPTEPNRWFIHAADADVYDGSPTEYEIAKSQTNPWGGFEFKNGSIFAHLDKHDVKWRIYACDSFPNVSELDGISRTWEVDEFEDFLEDIKSADYDAGYTFIEPSYDVFDHFRGGNSQHPLGSAKAGEMLIKRTYEALRASPNWDSSMLIVTYDEHGGYYDHVAPPPAKATGHIGRDHGFTFEQSGPRVPAIVISPLAPKNLIDHRHYEHSSIISTLIDVFKMGPLTPRSSATSGLKHLAYLDAPRDDAPMTLANPYSGVTMKLGRFDIANVKAAQPNASLAEDRNGNIAGAIRGGLNQHLQLTPPEQHAAIRARVQALQTQGEALEYLKEVDALVQQARAKAGVTRSPTVRRRRKRHELLEPMT